MVPNHIAIILDGNGRWAKAKGMPRTYGHTVGAKNVETISRAAWDLGVKYLTMYAFSTENWNRSSDEVETLMNLFSSYLKTCMKTSKKDDLKMRIIGDKSKLSPMLQDQIAELEDYTKDHQKLNLTLAINYGSRDEITRAVKRISEDTKNGIILPQDIDDKLISDYLDTRELPDPDLMIRTSGEQRLSNYLLWQLAYSEFYFTPKAWPEFTPDDLKEAVEAFEGRNRRFGKEK